MIIRHFVASCIFSVERRTVVFVYDIDHNVLERLKSKPSRSRRTESPSRPSLISGDKNVGQRNTILARLRAISKWRSTQDREGR